MSAHLQSAVERLAHVWSRDYPGHARLANDLISEGCGITEAGMIIIARLRLDHDPFWAAGLTAYLALHAVGDLRPPA